MTNRGDTGRLHCFHQVKEKKRKEGEAARGQILWENFFLLPLLSPLSVLNDISLRFADSNFFADESWRQLAFPSNFIFAHKRLKNHTIRNVNVRIRIYAGRLQCYKEPNCISIYSKSRQINRAKEPVSTPNQILEKEKVNLGLLVQSPIKLILD